MATNNVVYQVYPKWGYSCLGVTSNEEWNYHVQKSYPIWSPFKLYELNDVVQYNNYLYKASKFIYLKGMTDNPSKAITNIYGRNYRVWHCIGNLNYFEKKYFYSYNKKVEYNSEKMPDSDGIENSHSYYNQNGEEYFTDTTLDALTVYYRNLDDYKLSNFSGKINSDFNYKIVPRLLKYDPLFSETGDLDKPYENHDTCMSRRMAHSPYNIQKSDYKYERTQNGELIAVGLADKYDKRASIEYIGNPPYPNDTGDFIKEPLDFYGFIDSIYLVNGKTRTVFVGGTSKEYFYNWKTGGFETSDSSGNPIYMEYKQPQDTDMMYQYSDAKSTDWIDYQITKMVGGDDYLLVYFRTLNFADIGRIVTYHCVLTITTYYTDPVSGNSSTTVDTQSSEISFEIKENHYNWQGVTTTVSEQDPTVINVTGVAPDIALRIPPLQSGNDGYTTFGMSATLTSLSNNSY
jgi:hypothetical protein